jgi:hypothetical protein
VVEDEQVEEEEEVVWTQMHGEEGEQVEGKS